MKAEYIIGLEILCFLIGYLIGDLKNLGAARAPRKRTHPPRSAPPPSRRKPW